MENKRKSVILLGAFVVVVLALFGYLALKVGSVNTGGGIEVQALFNDAQGLVENGSVRIAGIKVGTITGLQVDGHKARVSMVLDPSIKVRKDVRATIKAKSLLGEKFIELIPQSETAPLLENGDIIGDTFVAAELPDLASQIAPLLSRINPEDVSRLVRVVAGVLEKNEKDFPRVIQSLGNIAVSVDKAIERNGPKVDRIVDAAYEAVYKAGPKVERLVDTTQQTLDRTNRMLDTTGPKIERFVGHLSELDIARLNRMITEADKALAGAPETLGQAREIIYKVNALLDGFDGLTWHDLKTLVRDEGIHVRLKARSDEEIQAEKDRWDPKKRVKITTQP